MKKKIGTILDEGLIYKTKQIALLHKQSFSNLLEDALKMYLLTVNMEKFEKKTDISRSTHGAMKVSKDILKAVLKEDNFYEVE